MSTSIGSILRCLVLAVLLDAAAIGARAQPDADVDIRLPRSIELVDLVELVSERLAVSLAYRPEDVGRQSISLRLRRSVSAQELWSVFQDVLAGAGLAVTRGATEGAYRIGKLSDLSDRPDLMLILDSPRDMRSVLGELDQRLGHVAFIIPVTPQAADRLAGEIATLLSATGECRVISKSGRLLIADSRSRLIDVLQILELLLGDVDRVVSEVVTLGAVDGQTLKGELDAVLDAWLAGDPRRDEVRTVALDRQGGLFIWAPSGLMARVVGLAEQLDAAAGVETLPYASATVGPTDLAASISTYLQANGVERPMVVAEEITGVVFVTAGSAVHGRVDAFIRQIDETGATAREGVVIVAVMHRPASEVRELVDDILSGATDSTNGAIAPVARSDTDGASAAPMAGSRGESVFGSRRASLDPGSSPDPAPTAARTRVGPRVSITVDEITNSLILVGDQRSLRAAESLIEQLDRREPQVMIDITLLALSESEALDLGTELRTTFESGGTSYNLSSLFGLAADGALSAGSGLTAAVVRPGDFEVLFRALEVLSVGRTISAPKVLVNNNETASIRSVERQPFTSINASNTVATTSFGGTQDAGTTVTVTPSIAAGDHLILDYSVELSAFTGDSITIEGQGVIPPPSQQTTIDSSVTIPDGYSVVTGGVISSRVGEAKNRIPGIGSLPLLDLIFGTRSETESSSRFYVIIRSTIMRNTQFDDLKSLNARDLAETGVGDGSPDLAPVWIQ